MAKREMPAESCYHINNSLEITAPDCVELQEVSLSVNQDDGEDTKYIHLHIPEKVGEKLTSEAVNTLGWMLIEAAKQMEL